MLRLLALIGLLAAVAAQPSFYCNSNTPIIIRHPDFYLITRRNSTDWAYPRDLVCDFNAESNSSALFVEIQEFQVSTAIVTISSGGSTLFRGSNIQNYQSSIVTPLKSLRVRFDASGDNSRSAGVTLRVRTFDSNGCPPGWVYLYGNCFGTSNRTGRLDYANAQRACNSMRSNLLQLPYGYGDSIRSFVRLLPSHLKSSYRWIGLTDLTSSGRFKYYWLNGDGQNLTSEISCVSGGAYWTCYSYERCGSIFDKDSFFYAIYMGDCDRTYYFACSMPPGGTSNFYLVPDYREATSTTVRPTVRPRSNGLEAWIWAVLVACVLVVGLIIVGIYRSARSRNLRRRRGGTNVVVSTGRIITLSPAPSTIVPLPGPTVLSPNQNPLCQISDAPPSYESVIAGGYGNPGFQSNK